MRSPVRGHTRLCSAALCAVALASGCGEASPAVTDGAVADASADAVYFSDGALPRSFAVPAPAAFTNATRDPRTLQVSISSEDLGQRGFDYTAMPPTGAVTFVDGWEVRFARILLTVGNIRLNRPGSTPADQSSVGAPVATLPGVFAVDVQKPGPLTGAGGAPETAIPLGIFHAAASGATLDPAVRYAFSYGAIAASSNATNVNLDAAGVALYAQMLQRGWSQYVEGTATYRGTTTGLHAAFADYPAAVTFRFGWSSPAQYLNCNNPDNGGDDMPGVQPSASTSARAQLTFHMDHLFWGALNVEDPPSHFDQFAARAQTIGEASIVTLDDLMGVAPTNLLDRRMRPVPDRGGQTRGYTPRNANALSFDPGGAPGVRDLRDFATYSARSNGHLNADGLCFVRPLSPITY